MALRIRRGTDLQRSGVTLESGEIAWTTDARQMWVGDGLQQGGYPVVGSNVAGYGLSYNGTSHKLEVAGLNTDDIAQGTNNKYFSTELAQDAAATLFTNPAASHSHITFQYDDSLNVVNATVALDGIGILNVVDDTSPSLGGELDLNDYDISGTGNITNTGNITATGTISSIDGSHTLSISGPNITSSTNVVTVGSSSGPHTLTVIGTSISDVLGITATTGTTNGPNIAFSAVKGTVASPTALAVNDVLGQIRFQGWQNTPVGYTQANLVTINTLLDVAGDGGATLPRGKLQFLVANGPNPANAAKLEFDKDGLLSTPSIRVGDGTAGSPSIGFTTDGSTDTGFFHPGDGIVCISTDSTERVRIDNGGMRVAGFLKVGSFNGTLPSPEEAGMIVFDSGTGQFKGWNGSTWAVLG